MYKTNSNPFGLLGHKKLNRLIIATTFLTIIAGLLTFFTIPTNPANAESVSKSTDLIVNVAPVLSLALQNCPSAPDVDETSLTLSLMPTPSGTFRSNCQKVSVETNAPGYTLLARANSTDATNNLLYQNPTTASPKPYIPPTANNISSPNVITPNTWGFAVENQLGFDSSYTVNNAANKYAQLPTYDTTIYQTAEFPGQTDIFSFYYGVNLNSATVAGTYQTTVTYTAVGEIPLAPSQCGTVSYECIIISVNTTDGTYRIPTSGYLNPDTSWFSSSHAYDWLVYVDGVLTSDCPSGNCIGISHSSNTSVVPGVNGILLTGLSNGIHQIKIFPNGTPTPGWGNAFGHYSNTTGANANANKQKLVSIDAPLTTMTFAPKTSESTTDARYMFGFLFYGATNLTTPATMIDTYKLPSTITKLPEFLSNIHRFNSQLTTPINLSALSGWLKANNTIQDLSDFLYCAHCDNTQLATPINLSPISGWFNANTSITRLNSFLATVHYNNTQLTNTIDLAPLSNWFYHNNTMTYMWFFLGGVHERNVRLTKTIDLTPLTNWFYHNNSIVDLQEFLYSVHFRNQQLINPVDLTPVTNWFYQNTSIKVLSEFLYAVHYENDIMASTIDLAPLAGWFYHNTSITDMDWFMYGIHSDNYQITDPIDLTVLADWFDVTELDYSYCFLCDAHYDNTSLILNGQVILPNWIETVTDGYDPLWDSNSAFNSMFSLYVPQTGDTSEVKLMNGHTLSSLGNPYQRRYTYFNRTDLDAQVMPNWR